MDLALVERENTLIGQDFLTWLWFKTESESPLFTNRDNHTFHVNMEQRISVQGGEGEGKETASVSSPRGELTEAKTGLRTGKKVQRAQLRFEMDQDEWFVQLKADDFSLSGFKTPKINTKDEEGDDPDAKFLEKIYLLEKCLDMLDTVFAVFLKVRLDKGWDAEADKIKDWIES
ncbi:hypothetical protein [Pseudodesulfovibrio senegalensis]|jgi:hypothetical protein|uniref:Uncharacterized protein n=1 Tax=Pseudodesulfovibrio senegalensis TaxID=1721087 RepID=A0A6N6N9Y1_9BACT|nr:hypothetical protein [Pseudodesulfovibrio senegalensis]KAB1443587.1 hypothetical protein F8A88_04905 [Pseudodesulfovibrio senegalensis]